MKEQIAEMASFMWAGRSLQKSYPEIAETLYNAGYRKQREIADDIIAIIEQRMERNIERMSGCQSGIWKVGYLAENEAYQDIKEIIEQRMKGGSE